MTRRLLATLAMLLAITGCAAPTPADYADQKPALDLRRYFDGELTAHGFFADRDGRVQRRFVVTLSGRWQGNEGVLDENFVFSDGATQRRVWHLTYHGDGRYSGSADDIVGQAEGRAAGNALNWRYTMKLPIDGAVYEVQFDDWMFLIDDAVMLNRAVMSKFGIRLGELTLAFSRK